MAQDLTKTIAQDIEGFIPSPVRKLWSGYSSAFDGAKAATSKKADTSWHDKEVEEANESFKKSAQKKSEGPKLGQKKSAKKSAAKKKLAAKKRN